MPYLQCFLSPKPNYSTLIEFILFDLYQREKMRVNRRAQTYVPGGETSGFPFSYPYIQYLRMQLEELIILADFTMDAALMVSNQIWSAEKPPQSSPMCSERAEKLLPPSFADMGEMCSPRRIAPFLCLVSLDLLLSRRQTHIATSVRVSFVLLSCLSSASVYTSTAC